MKKILIALLFVSGMARAQGDGLKPVYKLTGFDIEYFRPFVAGYTNIFSRYKWLAGAFDSGLHVPQYNGVPTDRTGVWMADGAVAVDTLNGHFYYRQGGVWVRVAKFSEIAAGTLSGFTTFGSTPNANGGSVSGANIILQPADGTNPGGVSTTTQTFAGVKTFTTPNFVTGFTIGGAATSRKMIVGNGTNFVPSTETWAVPGTSGNVLTSDGTNWTSAAPSGSITTPNILYVRTNGNDATGTVGDLAKPYLTMDAALIAGAALGNLVVDVGPGTFASPTHAFYIKANTTIQGVGKGQLNSTTTGSNYPNIVTSTPTGVTGGTIFQGMFEIPLVDNVHFKNFNVDVGSAFIGGGAAQEGLFCSSDTLGSSPTHSNQSGKKLRQNVTFENITVCQKDTSSLVHAFNIECCFLPKVTNLETWGGFAGVVVKSVGAQLNDIKVHRANANYYGIIIKQNDYAYSYNTLLDGFYIDGGGGLTIHNESGDDSLGLRNVTIKNGFINNTSYGVQQLGEKLYGIKVSDVVVNKTSGKGFDFNDVRFSTIDNNKVDSAIFTGFDITGRATTVSNNTAMGGSTYDYSLTGISDCSPILAYNNKSFSNTFSQGFNYGNFVYGNGNYGSFKTGSINATSETGCVGIAGGGGVIHYSSFTAADGTLITAYTPEVGNAWTNLQGTFDIQSNRASALPSSSYAASVTDIGRNNFSITAVGKRGSGTNYLQILTRVTDINNNVTVHIDGSTLAVYNVVAGSASLIASQVYAEGAVDHTYLVTVNGSMMRVYVDGANYVNVAIPGTQPGTKAGIGQAGTATNALVTFDSFIVTD